MIEAKDYYDHALALHGHKCPAMPLGLRAGAAAMNALGVTRSADTQLLALVETGEDHAGTCYADGVQMITGCTFGKGNIEKLHYGKWGLTLIDTATGRAVRVTPTAATLQASLRSVFVTEYRAKGVPASQVPPEITEPLILRVMEAPGSELLAAGQVTTREIPRRPKSFTGLVCGNCGETVIERYARVAGGKTVCIPCQQQLTGTTPASPRQPRLDPTGLPALRVLPLRRPSATCNTACAPARSHSF